MLLTVRMFAAAAGAGLAEVVACAMAVITGSVHLPAPPGRSRPSSGDGGEVASRKRVDARLRRAMASGCGGLSTAAVHGNSPPPPPPPPRGGGGGGGGRAGRA